MGTALDEELARRARAHGFAVFENRLIFEAQPPIRPEVLAEIEDACAGPVPDGLKALWRTAFGGRLDYDLEAVVGDRITSFSFREIFFPDSGGYRDLWGWIAHERELAEEAAKGSGETFDGRLRYLPFGGFEYLDRFYVCVEPGPEYGSVIAWMQGLPPAWVLRINEDSIGRVANDMAGLFVQLGLEEDPTRPGSDDDYRSGTEALEAIDALPEADVAEALRALLDEAVLDWRGALADGTIAQSPRLARLAMRDAVTRGDREAVARIEAAGWPLDAVLHGGGNALDHALAFGQMALAAHLLDRGLDATKAVRNGAGASPPDMVRRLLAAGAEADPVSAGSACMAGLDESARIIAAALSRKERTALVQDLERVAADQELLAQRIEQETIDSNMTPTECRDTAKRLRALRDDCLGMNRRWW